MPLSAKIIFTVASAACAVALLFVNPNINNAGPNWFWRGGERDLARWAVCRQDGTLRKYTKLTLFGCFVFFLAIIWLVA